MSNHQSYHVLDDLELFLYGLKLGDLIPLFKDHEVTFPQLLQISEADLEKVGIRQVFTPTRSYILQGRTNL